MPGSCESDKSSPPSLISSLRNFRFASKTQPYQPSAGTSTNGRLSRNGQPSSSVNAQSAAATTSKAAQNYSPLSYRKYEATVGTQFILPCVINKFQQVLRKGSHNALELELKLTNEELSKVKELILQDSNISESWKRLVSHEAQSFESPCEKVLRINRQYLSALLKFVKSASNDNIATNHTKPYGQTAEQNPNPSHRTYSRTDTSAVKAVPVASGVKTYSQVQPDLSQVPLGQTKVIMDEYEVFCSKEQNLRKLLDAFPGADIMEAQDILVKCDWNLKKAMVLAQNQPLRCSKKRALSISQTSGDGSQHQGSSTDSQHSGSSRNSIDTSVGAEEIVLDSSDEESIKPKNVKNKINHESNDRPRAKRARLVSSSESEDENSSSAHSSTSATKVHNVQKSVQPAVSGSNSVSSAIPNLPLGLMITQVGNASSASDNKAETSVNSSAKGEASSSKTEASHSNSNKMAQLVRLNSAVSIQPSDKNANFSKALSVTPVPKGVSVTPVPKGVSITPVPKGVSITPVGGSGQTRTSNNKNASGSDTSKRASKKSKNSKGKRKKVSLDDDDDEEYGNDLIFDSDESDYEEENLTHAHKAVFKFFQESSPEELATIPGCSKRKIEIIQGSRPFSDWQHLVAKLSEDKYLSTDLLNGAKKVLDMRSAINKLMTKCQQIAIDMEDLVENLKENKESSSDYVTKQPSLLNDRMHLTSYQMLGLNWLLLLHNQEVNGILADEMGLGKTIQAISFLAYLKEISVSGPHLIVVPASVLDNWKLELKTWWPDVSMICYYGKQDSRRELRMRILNDDIDEFDVMITTYNMVTTSTEDRVFLKRLEFHYVVFDEAHMLKNMASQRYQQLMRIQASRRLLLTGTPLQNNLVELMSLLIFAMPHMFSGKTEQIKLMFSAVSRDEKKINIYEKDRIDHAKRIMKPFVLRRLKKDVRQDIPAKHEHIKMCTMTDYQAEKYKELVEKLSAEVARNQEKDDSNKDDSNKDDSNKDDSNKDDSNEDDSNGDVSSKDVLNKDVSNKETNSGTGMMMQLRRAANHPLLLRRLYDDKKIEKMSYDILKEPTHAQSDPKLVWEDMSLMHDFELHKLCKSFKSLKSYILPDDEILNSGKFQVLDTMLPSLFEENHRVLLFSQFTMVLDIMEELMDMKDIKYIRLDGSVPVVDRQDLIDQFNSDPSIFVFLLSTKAGGLGINLTEADTVILHDIDFNPYNDKQAEDRCHRVGQKREVNVYRFISEDTIEEGILLRAKEKLKLERDIHEETTVENDVSLAKLLRDTLGVKSIKS